MKVCIFYHFEMGNTNLSLDFKKLDILDPFTPNTYPGDSALEKFPQKLKIEEYVKIFKF